ncbi:MAG TPA: ABC transporter permease subunit [Egicoccus sp.]|nr:ABC transporter permease subunit [Egicoccus sp.]HSK22165.1 ABC transporter permease subunit [Egicoccus sp.]
MNWRGIKAVVKRDLRLVWSSKSVVIPSIVVPALLLVLLPALAGIVPTFVDFATAGDLDALLSALPDRVVEGLSPDPGLMVAEVVVTWMLAPLVLLVPVMFAAVVAADGIAGEKERGTLEGLLLTPLSDRELAVAKLMAAWIPAAVLGIGGALLYATVANLAVGTQLGRLVLPTTEFTLMALWVGPTFALAAMAAVSLVSARVKTTQEAFQIGGVVVIPVVAMLVSQASGALLLSAWLLVGAGVVALVIAAFLLRAASRALSRDRLGTRLT